MPAGETPVDPAELAGLLGNYRLVSPGYFETFGMVLNRGRVFTGPDRGRPVAVVTAQTASRLWPGEDPIGRRFLRGNSPDRPSQEVVGVVADARILGLDVDPGLVPGAREGPGAPGPPKRPRPWAAVPRGWNRGRTRRVLTETPMNPGVFRCIRAIPA